MGRQQWPQPGSDELTYWQTVWDEGWDSYWNIFGSLTVRRVQEGLRRGGLIEAGEDVADGPSAFARVTPLGASKRTVVMTDRRLFLARARPWGGAVASVDFNDISSVELPAPHRTVLVHTDEEYGFEDLEGPYDATVKFEIEVLAPSHGGIPLATAIADRAGLPRYT